MTKISDCKHIALVIRALINRNGDAERIYCELANLFAESGYRVTCLYFDDNAGEPFYQLNHTIERINLYGKARLWVRRLASAGKYLPSRIRDKANWDVENSFFVQQLNDYFSLVKPDVVISLMPPANTPTLIAAEGKQVKVIACNHDVPAQDYGNPNRWSKNAVDRDLRLRVLDRADVVHVLFPDFGEWFPQNLQDRVVAIPNYLSPEFKRPVIRPSREKVVMAVGKLAEVKSYLGFINSWATIAREFPDWKLKIFGIGLQNKRMEEAIGRVGLYGKIELSGQLKQPEEEFAKASIFCHPGDIDGFSFSAAEALYFETPVVFYADSPGVKAFVQDGVNGLAVSREGDHDQLAGALRRLILDDGLRRSLGANGPQSVSAFTLDHYRKSWLNLLAKMTRQ